VGRGKDDRGNETYLKDLKEKKLTQRISENRGDKETHRKRAPSSCSGKRGRYQWGAARVKEKG